VLADSERITQVITNLVVNAINYTPQGGLVSVAVERNDEDDAVKIQISDNGIGIPAELQPQLFKPFFRANVSTFHGTGLGLTISQEIVRLHQGTISVVSRENVGTTFVVQLPQHPSN
jgi:signal transduction histidine kinase